MPSKCQLRKSNCSFPRRPTAPPPIGDESLATSPATFYSCDIFLIFPPVATRDAPCSVPCPLSVLHAIPSDSTFCLFRSLARARAVKLDRSPPRHPLAPLKVGSKLKGRNVTIAVLVEQHAVPPVSVVLFATFGVSR